jgi:hypothetical protein
MATEVLEEGYLYRLTNGRLIGPTSPHYLLYQTDQGTKHGHKLRNAECLKVQIVVAP